MGSFRSGKEYIEVGKEIELFKDRVKCGIGMVEESDGILRQGCPKKIRFTQHEGKTVSYVDSTNDAEQFDEEFPENDKMSKQLLKQGLMVDRERIDVVRTNTFDIVYEMNMDEVKMVPNALMKERQTDIIRDFENTKKQFGTFVEKKGYIESEVLKGNIDRAIENCQTPLYQKYLSGELKKGEFPLKYDRVHFKHNPNSENNMYSVVLSKETRESAGVDVWLLPGKRSKGMAGLDLTTSGGSDDSRFPIVLELNLGWRIIRGYKSEKSGASFPYIEIAENSTNCDYFEVFRGVVDGDFGGYIKIKIAPKKKGMFLMGFNEKQPDEPLLALKICQFLIKGGNVDFDRIMIEKEDLVEMACIEGYWVDRNNPFYKLKTNYMSQHPVSGQVKTVLNLMPILAEERQQQAFRSTYENSETYYRGDGTPVYVRKADFIFEGQMVKALGVNFSEQQAWWFEDFFETGDLDFNIDFDYSMLNSAVEYEQLHRIACAGKTYRIEKKIVKGIGVQILMVDIHHFL